MGVVAWIFTHVKSLVINPTWGDLRTRTVNIPAIAVVVVFLGLLGTLWSTNSLQGKSLGAVYCGSHFLQGFDVFADMHTLSQHCPIAYVCIYVYTYFIDVLYNTMYGWRLCATTAWCTAHEAWCMMHHNGEIHDRNNGLIWTISLKWVAFSVGLSGVVVVVSITTTWRQLYN